MAKKKTSVKHVKIKFVKPNKSGVFLCKNTGKRTQVRLYLEKREILEQISGAKNLLAVDKNKNEIIDEELVKSKLEATADFEAKRKKKKSIITNLILLAVNLFLVVFLASALIKNAEDASISALISAQGDRLYYLLYGVLIFVVFIILDLLVVSLLIKKTTGKFRLWLSYKTTANGKYYEAITPLAVGGQPAQIVTLAKGGVTPGIATSIPIIKMTITNFVIIMVAVLSFIFIGPTITFENGFWDILTSLLKILAYIGAFINLLYLMLIIIVGNSKVVGRSIARTYIKIGYKLKLVKNYRKAYDKFMRQVFEFQDSMAYLKKNASLLISSILITAVGLVVYGSVPFVISIAMSNIEFATTGAAVLFWLQCVTKYNICYMAASFIPLPGGTGMNEIAFVILFAPIIGSNFIVWGFLAWRLMTYYATILQGIVFVVSDTIGAAVKKDKGKKPIAASKINN